MTRVSEKYIYDIVATCIANIKIDLSACKSLAVKYAYADIYSKLTLPEFLN